jgi:hypothetical protein
MNKVCRYGTWSVLLLVLSQFNLFIIVSSSIARCQQSSRASSDSVQWHVYPWSDLPAGYDYEEIYHGDSGIFVANKDTVIPLVTKSDTIPGSSALFQDIDDFGGFFGRTLFGGKQMWWRTHAIDQVGLRRAVFGYLHNDEIGFYMASPGKIDHILTLPKKITIADKEFNTSDPKRLRKWQFTMAGGRSQINTFWFGISAGFPSGEVSSGVITFDAEHYEELVRINDTVQYSDLALLHFIGFISVDDHFVMNSVEFDRDANECFFYAYVWVFDRQTGERTSVKIGFFLVRGKKIVPILLLGQNIDNVDDARITDNFKSPEIVWRPDFEHHRILALAPYKANRWYHGFFAASEKGIERIGAWKEGDILPGTNGGRIEQFWRTKQGVDIYDYDINPDSQEVISFISIKDSESDIEEGIFSCRGDRITKLVAQNDLAPVKSKGVFSSFYGFTLDASKKMVLFSAQVKSSFGVSDGLFVLSKGMITKIVMVNDTISCKTKEGRIANMPLTAIKEFKLVSNGMIKFRGFWRDGSDWFLAIYH